MYYPHFTSANKYVFNLQCPKQEKKLSLHLYNDATVRGDIHYFDVCKVTDSGMGSKSPDNHAYFLDILEHLEFYN